MQTILLVNPRKAKRKKSSAKKSAGKVKTMAPRKRNAKGRFVKATSKRRASPKRRKTTAVATRKTAPVRRRRAAPVATRKRRVTRRNPRMGTAGRVMSDAALGTVGSVVTSLIMGFVPLPAALNTGYAKQAVKGFVAIMMGVYGGKLIGKANAVKMATGALTVMGHNMAAEMIGGALPLGNYHSSPSMLVNGAGGLYIDPATGEAYAMPSGANYPVNEFVPAGVGEFVSEYDDNGTPM